MGVAVSTSAPIHWDGRTGEGVLWKTPVPLKGASSPVVWGRRVFLTGADKTRREVYCYDADSGSLLWRSRVENVPGGGLPSGDIWDDKTHAAATPVTDGRHVYAVFVNGDLVCIDFEGNRVWARGLGPVRNAYGHASSLAMYRNLLLVQLDQAKTESGEWRSKLMALDSATGRTVWETERPVPESWATPIVAELAGREQIITCADPWVIAYDPETGDEIWKVSCLSGYVTPSAVAVSADEGGLVFAMVEEAELRAIRPDGAGDVTRTHVVWTYEDDLPSVPSPVLAEAAGGTLLFVLSSGGIMTCLDARSGEKHWDEDLEVSCLASPTVVDDRIYVIGDDGVGVVIGAGAQFEEISRPELGEYVQASPAFAHGRIYLRGEEHLFCIAGPSGQRPRPDQAEKDEVPETAARPPGPATDAAPSPETGPQGEKEEAPSPAASEPGEGDEDDEEEEFLDWE
jgi:outer membrane protein assembly factor BamB